MGLFTNLFSCTCDPSNAKENFDDQMRELKQNVVNLEMNVKTLLTAKLYTNTELNRLEDKLNNQFNLLQTKIDSVILILNTKKD